MKRRQETGSVLYTIPWQGKPSFLRSQSPATQSRPHPGPGGLGGSCGVSAFHGQPHEHWAGALPFPPRSLALRSLPGVSPRPFKQWGPQRGRRLQWGGGGWAYAPSRLPSIVTCTSPYLSPPFSPSPNPDLALL